MQRRNKLAISIAVLAVFGAAVKFRRGQVFVEIAGWNRVFGFQGIRGLVGGLFGTDRRSAQGNYRQSNHDQCLQSRSSGQP